VCQKMNAAMPNQSYIIAGNPRSGTHLLADGLSATGIAGFPDERFVRPREKDLALNNRGRAFLRPTPPEEAYIPQEDSKFVRAVIETGTTANGVFGVTVHHFQLNDVARRVASYLGCSPLSAHQIFSMAFPNLSYVWLRRRDKVAQAVSWHKAAHSGQFVKIEGKQGAPRTGGAEFDYAAIRTYWSALRSADNGWQHFFLESEVRPYILYYEDLASNYEGTIRDVMKYLKLTDQPYTVRPPRHQKVADAQSLAWIAQFNLMNVSRRQSTRASLPKADDRDL